MRTAVADDDASTYSRLNSTLHRRLREISGHTVADSLVANLRNRSAHHQYQLASMPGRSAESVEQHASIVAAVVTHNEEAAGNAMHDHLMSVIDALRRGDDRYGSFGRPSIGTRRRLSTVERVITGSMPRSVSSSAAASISWSRRTACGAGSLDHPAEELARRRR